jgi:protein-L-isoaspartate(D-aspartate) O-methyltransferase
MTPTLWVRFIAPMPITPVTIEREGAMQAPKEPDIPAMHQALVDQLKKNGYIHDARAEAAFRAVPRHLFLPGVPLDEVYRDEAIATRSINGQVVSSSSQPTIMAIMLEQLRLQPGHRVLEIGSGTGYNAALMAHIVGETGEVITIDIDEDIVEAARAHLISSGFGNVHVLCADGGLGYPDAAPYDRIILTVNAADITPAWHTQLKPDGRLLLPLVLRGPQASIAFMPIEDHLESLSVRACGFVGLRGAFAEADPVVQLSPELNQLVLRLGEARPIDAQAVYALLQSPAQDIALSVSLEPRELFFGPLFWLALHEPLFCSLSASTPLAEQGIIPTLAHLHGKTATTIGLLTENALSVLMRNPAPASANAFSSGGSFKLYLRSFGSADLLAQQLKQQIIAWDTAGRPGEQQLHVRAYPQGVTGNLKASDIVIAKRWTNFVYSWQ